jgi:hypothetical protein
MPETRTQHLGPPYRSGWWRFFRRAAFDSALLRSKQTACCGDCIRTALRATWQFKVRRNSIWPSTAGSPRSSYEPPGGGEYLKRKPLDASYLTNRIYRSSLGGTLTISTYWFTTPKHSQAAARAAPPAQYGGVTPVVLYQAALLQTERDTGRIRACDAEHLREEGVSPALL